MAFPNATSTFTKFALKLAAVDIAYAQFPFLKANPGPSISPSILTFVASDPEKNLSSRLSPLVKSLKVSLLLEKLILVLNKLIELYI